MRRLVKRSDVADTFFLLGFFSVVLHHQLICRVTEATGHLVFKFLRHASIRTLGKGPPRPGAGKGPSASAATSTSHSKSGG